MTYNLYTKKEDIVNYNAITNGLYDGGINNISLDEYEVYEMDLSDEPYISDESILDGGTGDITVLEYTAFDRTFYDGGQNDIDLLEYEILQSVNVDNFLNYEHIPSEQNVWDAGQNDIPTNYYKFLAYQMVSDITGGLYSYPDGGMEDINLLEYTFIDMDFAESELYDPNEESLLDGGINDINVSEYIFAESETEFLP